MEESNPQVLIALGELKQLVEGTNHRLDTLNSSVAKHEMRLASQDVLNAQMTITQNQIVEDMKGLKKNAESFSVFRISFNSSLNTLKWLCGFFGAGNIIILLKVLNLV